VQHFTFESELPILRFYCRTALRILNVFGPVFNQTPNAPCFQPGGPNGCVDWSAFRPILLYGEFDPHLKTQYADHTILTIERQLTKSMVLRASYVGTQGHHLLALHDENAGNNSNLPWSHKPFKRKRERRSHWPGGSPTTCGPF